MKISIPKEVRIFLLESIYEKLHIKCDMGCPPEMIKNYEPDEFGHSDFDVNCQPEQCDAKKLQDRYSDILDTITFEIALNWINHPIMGEVANYITCGLLPDEYITPTEDVLTEHIEALL